MLTDLDNALDDPAGDSGAPSRRTEMRRMWRNSGVNRSNHAGRNRNPGNLRGRGDVGSRGGFAVFSSDERGYRALLSDLETKQGGKSTAMWEDDNGKKHPVLGTSTLAEVMRAYAPPHENNTAMYTAWIGKELNVDPNTTAIQDLDREAWATALATHEDRAYWESVQGQEEVALEDTEGLDEPQTPTQVYHADELRARFQEGIGGETTTTDGQPKKRTWGDEWKDSFKGAARSISRAIDGAFNFTVDVGAEVMNKANNLEIIDGVKLGSLLYKPGEFEAWYTLPSDDRAAPVMLGDEKRAELFGAKPEGFWGTVEDIETVVASQVGAFFLLGGVTNSGAALSTIQKMEISGITSAMTGMDSHMESLANLGEDHLPGWGKDLVSWMAVHEDDTALEGRVKHGVEALMLSGIIAGSWAGTKWTSAKTGLTPILERQWASLKLWKEMKLLQAGVGSEERVQNAFVEYRKAGGRTSAKAGREATDKALLTKADPPVEVPTRPTPDTPEVSLLEGTDGEMHHYPIAEDGSPRVVGDTPEPKRGTESITEKKRRTLSNEEPADLVLEKPLSEKETQGRPSQAHRDFQDEVSKRLNGDPNPTNHAQLWGDTGVEVHITSTGPNAAKLEWIGVPEALQGQGVGPKVMREITEMADAHGITIELNAVPQNGLTQTELRNWYRRFGFERTSWRAEAHMIRRPGAKMAEVVQDASTVFGSVPHPAGGFSVAANGVPIEGIPPMATQAAADNTAATLAVDVAHANGDDALRAQFRQRLADAMTPIFERYGLGGKNAEQVIEGLDFNFSRVNNSQEALATINVISKLIKEKMASARSLGFAIDDQKLITALTYSGHTLESATQLVKEAAGNTQDLFAHVMGSETVLQQAATELNQVARALEQNPSNFALAQRQISLANTIYELQPAVAELHANVGRALRAAGEKTPIKNVKIDFGTVAENLVTNRKTTLRNIKPVLKQAQDAVEALTRADAPEAVLENATQVVEAIDEAAEQLLDSSLEATPSLKDTLKQRAKARKAALRADARKAAKSAKGKAPRKAKAPDLIRALEKAQEDLMVVLEEIGLKKNDGVRAIREPWETPPGGSTNNLPRFTKDLSTAGSTPNPVTQFMNADAQHQRNFADQGFHFILEAVEEAEGILDDAARDLAEKRAKTAAEVAAEEEAKGAARTAAKEEMKTPFDQAKELPLGRGQHSSPSTPKPAKPANPWTAPEGSGVFTGMTKKQIKSMSKAIILADGDPRVIGQLLQRTRQVMEPEVSASMGGRIFDFLYGGRIRAMLSGPPTHVTNFVSAMNQGFYRPAEMWFSGTIRGNTATAQLGKDLFTSAFTEAWEGLVGGAKSLKAGRILDPEMTYHATPIAKSKMPWFGKLYDAPLTALGGSDGVLKNWLYRQNVRARWLAKGRKLLASGHITDLGKYIDEGMEAAYNANTGAWTDPNAITYARELLFQTPPTSKHGRFMLDFAQEKTALGRIWKWMNPFVKVGYNLAQWSVQRTPVLWRLSTTMKEDLAAGGLRAAQAVAKRDAGKAMWAVSTGLAASGVITGGGPSNPALRDLYFDPSTGRQPYSFHVPGTKTWISYRRLEPFATMMGICADATMMFSEMADEDANDIATAMVLLMGQNATNKTYMQSMSDVFSSLTQRNGTRVHNLAAQNLLSLLPSFIRAANWDDMYRESRTILEAIQARIPGWSKHLEPRQNFLGHPAMKPPGMQGAWNIFTVTRQGDPQEARVVEALYEVGRALETPPEKIAGTEIKLTDRDAYADDNSPRFANGDKKSPYYRWQELVGQLDTGDGNFVTELDNLISSDEWKELSQTPSLEKGGAQYERLKSIYDTRRADAFNQLLEEYPKLGVTLDAARESRYAPWTQ